MGVFMIKGWDPFATECGGTSTLSRGETFATPWLNNEPHPNIKSVSGLEVSIPCGVVSTQGMSVFVLRLLELL